MWRLGCDKRLQERALGATKEKDIPLIIQKIAPIVKRGFPTPLPVCETGYKRGHFDPGNSNSVPNLEGVGWTAPSSDSAHDLMSRHDRKMLPHIACAMFQQCATRVLMGWCMADRKARGIFDLSTLEVHEAVDTFDARAAT